LNLNDIFVSRKKDSIPQSLSSMFTEAFLSKNLQKLDLSNNAIVIFWNKAPNGALALKPYLEKADSLKVLLINNCGLGIIGSTTISHALKVGTPNLEIWAMSRNRIEDSGAS
jgi:Ran GTPase-activating protein (RanGAP) involved in mRNA processing and transport